MVVALATLWLGACAQDAVPPAAPDDGVVTAVPADLAFETFDWHALLRDESGSVHAVRERFDRLSPRQPAETTTRAGMSRWRFDAIMRVDGAIVHASRPAHAWQSVQRAAAGLAVSQFDDTTTDERFGVLGHRVGRDAPVDMPSRCAEHWRLELGEFGRLTVTQPRCPPGEPLGELTRSLTGALPATLDWVQNGRPRSARGVAWLRHVQGPLPPPGGAVVFDTAVLTLAGIGTLELIRSRRRSGRGTPVVSGTLSSRGTRVVLNEPRWTPASSGTGGGRVVIGSLGVDVELGSIELPPADVSTTRPAIAVPATAGDGPGSGVVLFATGTHRGAGFAEFAAGGDE